MHNSTNISANLVQFDCLEKRKFYNSILDLSSFKAKLIKLVITLKGND